MTSPTKEVRMKKHSLFFTSGEIADGRKFEADSSQDGTAVADITIFREGRFQHSYYGSLNFDTNFLERVVSNFKRNILQRKIGFDAAHRPDNGAVAWIEDPDNGLFLEERTFDSVTGPKTRTFLKARAHFTPWGEQLVKDKIY